MTAIHQFVPTFEPGAVGSHMLAAQGVLRDAGFDSEIYAGEVRPDFAEYGAHDFHTYARHARATDRLMYHLAIGSVVADFLRDRAETLIVDHHNLTPLEYLDAWEPAAAGGVVWGRRQLAALAQRCSLGIGDSEFNAAELADAGYAHTTVVPILIPPAALEGPVDTELLDRLRNDATVGARWLFVGRLSPHKAQHDLVKSLAAYRRFHDDRAHLYLVGGSSSGKYETALRGFVERLDLEDAVTITGSVSDAAKGAYYEAADVFVTASEHEGFLVPLIEAMHHRVPIVAYVAGAVGETLAAAGLALDTKAPCTMAAAVARVMRDPQLRSQLVVAGTARRADFDITRTGPALVEAVQRVAPA